MAKKEKNLILYRNGELPERLADILGAADENDLRILVALMMSADGEGVLEGDGGAAELLGLDSSDVNASLKFWKGAGLIGRVRASAKAAEKTEAEEKKTEKRAEEPEKTVASAHRGGAVSHSAVSVYDSSELADLLESKRSLALFVNEAQRVLGKTLNYYDTSLLVGIAEQLGFDEEAVLAILAYAVRLKHATVRYAEKIAISFYDEGITDAEAVIDKINKIEASAETVSQIRSLFGMGTRSLSTTEKKLFTAWSEKLGYGIDAIRLAYDVTIDKIHEPAPRYVNSILERWHAEGLYTAADIEEYLRSQKDTGARGGLEKSYDTDEFFEAALRRSYEEFDSKYGTDK